MPRLLRTSAIALITVTCVIFTIRLFDWRMVIQALSRMHVSIFVLSSVPVIIGMFAVRGVRWLIVLGLSFNRRRLWQSFCANGVASGLASLTPFQLGEIVKIRMIPDHHGSAWRMGVPALFVERILDLAGVMGIGLSGLMLHLELAWSAAFAMLLPVWTGFALCVLAPLLRYAPHRFEPFVALLYRRSGIAAASILTVLLWLLYAALWWIAVSAISVSLDFGQIALLLGSVMLAVVASMTPGGLGVAELGSHGILLWLGKSHADADAAAIALRLLTPLLVLSGGLCMLLLLSYKHFAERKARA